MTEELGPEVRGPEDARDLSPGRETRRAGSLRGRIRRRPGASTPAKEASWGEDFHFRGSPVPGFIPFGGVHMPMPEDTRGRPWKRVERGSTVTSIYK